MNTLQKFEARQVEWIAANGQTYDVPDVLKSGDHAKIDDWRKQQSEEITKELRPELLND